MRTRRGTCAKEVEIVADDSDTEDENSEEEDNEHQESVEMQNNYDVEKDASDEEVGNLMENDITDQEICIDSLVTKTLQRFSSSKFNSRSKACTALHSRLISSGKLGDRKLQSTKGAIENQTWKTGRVNLG